MGDDLPSNGDLSKPTREKFRNMFSRELDEQMDKKQNGIQKITQMQFHDFEMKGYVKSDIKVKIDSHEKFSRKELEQKELILIGLTKKLQQKLTSYEKDKDYQKLLLKEEEQKKKISQELNQIVSKNYKKDSEGFLQSMSDKINMNIVPVINTINQILETNIVDETKKGHLETMKLNLFEFLDDTSRIAEYQRLVLDDSSIRKTIINSDEIIGKILKRQKIMADKKGINITFENYKVETIFCEEYRISFVLNNLIRNSINSCEKNGEIKIIISNNEKGTTIAVIDNGKGFSPELLDEILSSTKVRDPFAKGNEVKAGMIISRIIIHNHHGEFTVISQPGQKTEVSFNLPAQMSFTNNP